MEQDTRIGLAMGILLIGVVGALFFRNEQTPDRTVPELADTESLDAQIAERPIAPYLSRKEPTERVVDSTPTSPKAWTVPEFLKKDKAATAPATMASAPDPIPRTEASPAVPKKEVAVVPVPQPADQPSVVSPPVVETPAKSPEAEEALSEYRVRQGDTLSDISERFLGSSARYMEIYELNRERLKTPHDLRVGRRILVPRVRR